MINIYVSYRCNRLREHFSALVRPSRFEDVSTECHGCPDFKRFCQGGCMALKRQAPVPAYTGSLEVERSCR